MKGMTALLALTLTEVAWCSASKDKILGNDDKSVGEQIKDTICNVPNVKCPKEAVKTACPEKEEKGCEELKFPIETHGDSDQQQYVVEFNVPDHKLDETEDEEQEAGSDATPSQNMLSPSVILVTPEPLLQPAPQDMTAPANVAPESKLPQNQGSVAAHTEPASRREFPTSSDPTNIITSLPSLQVPKTNVIPTGTPIASTPVASEQGCNLPPEQPAESNSAEQLSSSPITSQATSPRGTAPLSLPADPDLSKQKEATMEVAQIIATDYFPLSLLYELRKKKTDDWKNYNSALQKIIDYAKSVIQAQDGQPKREQLEIVFYPGRLPSLDLLQESVWLYCGNDENCARQTGRYWYHHLEKQIAKVTDEVLAMAKLRTPSFEEVNAAYSHAMVQIDGCIAKNQRLDQQSKETKLRACLDTQKQKLTNLFVQNI
jgi:hypothetical protein